MNTTPRVILCWKNKFSGETGYVKSVSMKNRQFINTFNKTEAKKYNVKSILDKDLQLLKDIGEYDNNDFHIENI